MLWGCALLLLSIPALALAQSSLVLHLPMEDAANPVDASADPATVTVHGTLSSVDGQLGTKGLEFNGDNVNRIEVGSVPKLEGMSALTVEAWVLPRNLADQEGMCIVSKRLAWGDSDVYNIFVWQQQQVEARVNGAGPLRTATSLEDDTWYHIAYVFDGQGAAGEKMKIYINGVLEASGDHPDSKVNETGAPLWIGELDANRGFAWNGIIDEVGIWSVALNADQLNWLMGNTNKADILNFPSGPTPANGAVHEATWVTFDWTPGESAVSQDVYLGESFDEVNEATVDSPAYQGNQTDASLIAGFSGFPYPDGLNPGTTYYWRVDQINESEPDSPWKGAVWSFTVPPRTAYNPSLPDGAMFVTPDVELSWAPGLGGLLHTVYFGDDLDTVANATGGVAQNSTTFDPGPLEEGKTYYWRVDEFEAPVTHKGDVWSFTTVPTVEVADPDLIGWWTFDEGQGSTAVDWSGHGNHGTILGAAQWDPDGLDRGSLVLDGSSNHVVVEGLRDSAVVLEQYAMALWFRADRRGGARSLITAYTDGPTFGTLVELRPEGTMRFLHRSTTGGTGADLVTTGIYDDDAWHHVALVKTANELIGYIDGDVVVSEVTTDAYDGSFYVAIGVLDHLRANDRFFPGPLDDARIYNRALTQDEVNQIMRGDPTLAADPNPTRGAVVDIRDFAPLSWSAGDTAASHDVYFGTDRDAVAQADSASPEFQGNQTGTSLSVAGLVEFGGGDYYWRVDEIEADGAIVSGTVWKFTVPDYLIVEDFESYNDLNEDEEGSNRIYLTWIDGFGTLTNGSQAGNLDPPFMSAGRESAQAMPLSYDNAGKTSEATRTLTSKEDWTVEGVTKLGMWFRGDSANAADRMFVALGNAVVYHPDDAATQDTGWNEWVIELQDFADQGADLTNVGSITIGFGTRGAPVATGGTGTVDIDDITLIR
jgi:hypothetical protein